MILHPLHRTVDLFEMRISIIREHFSVSTLYMRMVFVHLAASRDENLARANDQNGESNDSCHKIISLPPVAGTTTPYCSWFRSGMFDGTPPSGFVRFYFPRREFLFDREMLQFPEAHVKKSIPSSQPKRISLCCYNSAMPVIQYRWMQWSLWFLCFAYRL